MTPGAQLPAPLAWADGRLAVRLALAIDLAGWCAILARPGDTFATSHAYDHLARWFTEPQFAGLCGIAAALLAMSAWAERRLARKFARAGAAGLAAALQAAVAVSFGGGPVVVTGFTAHLGLALLGSWLVWRELSGG